MKQSLEFIAWSLLNPICIIASFIATNYLGMYKSVSTNVIMLSREFISVYVLIGMIALVGQSILVYMMTRLISKHATMTKVFEVFLSAQYPFIVLIFITFALLTQVEGNIMGFLYIPIFLFLGLVSGIFVLHIYLKKIHGFIEPQQSSWTAIKRVCGIVAVTLAVSLYSIYFFGFNTHLASAMVGWRTDIPQYSVVQVIKAIRNRDPDVFAQYVDIDSFLEPEVDKVLLKAEIIDAVKQGRFLTDNGQRLKLGEWVIQDREVRRGIGTFKQVPIIDFWEICPKGDLWQATADFCSEVNGVSVRVTFALEKRNGIYKITNGSDANALKSVIKKVKEYYRALEEFPLLVNESDTLSTLSIKVTNILAELPQAGALENFSWVERDGGAKQKTAFLPVKVSAELRNNTDKPLTRIALTVVYRDIQTNRVLYVDDAFVFIGKEPLQPYEKRQFTLSSDVRPTLLLAIKEGRVKVAELYPLRVFYDDKHSSELLKVKIPRFSRMSSGNEVVTSFE